MTKTDPVFKSLLKFSNSFSVSIPLFTFVSNSLLNLHSHLFNQVQYTCDLFKYIPTHPKIVSMAKVCSTFGSEEFYCVVIPILTWNLLSYELNRAIVLLLCANLFVGNSCKNIFCLPRPPLKYRFDAVEKNMSERKLHVDALGFGWPSTHSSNAVSLPFAVLRTVYGALWQSCCSVPMFWAYFLAFLYATAVPFSRLVLGVHSAADVQAGMLYGVLHLRLWVVFQLEIGEFMDRATPGFIILAGLALCAVHPRVRPQNYTMEESVCIVAYTMGFLLGKLVGDEHGVTALAGDDAILPHYVLRVIIGFCVVLPLKAAIKELTKVMRTAQGGEGGGKNIDTYNFGFGDFVSRMLQYLLGFGVGTTFFAPFVFKALGI